MGVNFYVVGNTNREEKSRVIEPLAVAPADMMHLGGAAPANRAVGMFLQKLFPQPGILPPFLTPLRGGRLQGSAPGKRSFPPLERGPTR